MAGKVYKSIEEYIDAVEVALPDVAMKYIAPSVEDVLRAHIQHDIYDAYTPKEYVRRHSLLDTIESRMNGDTLETSAWAAPSPSWTGRTVYGSPDGGFLDLLESSDLGLWAAGFPRPAVGPAQADVDKMIPELEEMLVRGLEKMLG